ncbi:MAG TPA: ABC transporter substrate-binding protein [Actinomycetota bacterium]|nr:ABC transporter substrate-binding protein [Actinomycetota bacterium]
MRKVLLLAVCLATLMAACGTTGGPTPRGGRGGTIVVGVSGAFTENQLVAEMYAQVLENAGYRVERQFDLRSRELSQNALESGQIDLKPEYLSSLLLFLDPNADTSELPDVVAEEDAGLLHSKGITVLTPSQAHDTNEFVANAQTARRFHLTTMSSLAPVAGQLRFGGPPECPQRLNCLLGLDKVYGILFDDFLPLDVGGPQTIKALEDNQVQVGLLFSTDPSIRENGFVPLVDDRHLQNAENITPVIRSAVLNDRIRALLDGVSSKLTTGNVTAMVGHIVHGEDLPQTARSFLIEHGLL